MKILNGKKEAEKILDGLGGKVKGMEIKPQLAIISVAPTEASKVYVRNKKKAGSRIGIDILEFKFSATVKEKKIAEKIVALNKKASVNGIIIQLPVPKKFNADRLVKKVSSAKDVDGFKKDSLFQPVLPLSVYTAFKKAGKGLSKSRVVALVNSKVMGDELKSFFGQKGVRLSYILIKNFSKEKIKRADVLITVCGCPGLIKGDMIKSRATLIDAGITLKGGRVLGDVDRESVAKKAAFLTPVPGGIGPLTVALLLKNVYLSYGYSKNSKNI